MMKHNFNIRRLAFLWAILAVATSCSCSGVDTADEVQLSSISPSATLHDTGVTDASVKASAVNSCRIATLYLLETGTVKVIVTNLSGEIVTIDANDSVLSEGDATVISADYNLPEQKIETLAIKVLKKDTSDLLCEKIIDCTGYHSNYSADDAAVTEPADTPAETEENVQPTTPADTKVDCGLGEYSTKIHGCECMEGAHLVPTDKGARCECWTNGDFIPNDEGGCGCKEGTMLGKIEDISICLQTPDCGSGEFDATEKKCKCFNGAYLSNTVKSTFGEIEICSCNNSDGFALEPGTSSCVPDTKKHIVLDDEGKTTCAEGYYDVNDDKNCQRLVSQVVVTTLTGSTIKNESGWEWGWGVGIGGSGSDFCIQFIYGGCNTKKPKEKANRDGEVSLTFGVPANEYDRYPEHPKHFTMPLLSTSDKDSEFAANKIKTSTYDMEDKNISEYEFDELMRNMKLHFESTDDDWLLNQITIGVVYKEQELTGAKEDEIDIKYRNVALHRWLWKGSYIPLSIEDIVVAYETYTSDAEDSGTDDDVIFTVSVENDLPEAALEYEKEYRTSGKSTERLTEESLDTKKLEFVLDKWSNDDFRDGAAQIWGFHIYQGQDVFAKKDFDGAEFSLEVKGDDAWVPDAVIGVYYTPGIPVDFDPNTCYAFEAHANGGKLEPVFKADSYYTRFKDLSDVGNGTFEDEDDNLAYWPSAVDETTWEKIPFTFKNYTGVGNEKCFGQYKIGDLKEKPAWSPHITRIY